MKKSIAILITVFNRKEKTLTCLRSIYEQNGLEDYCVDIFIVDGGSTDGTPDAIKSQFPEVHVSIHDGLYWNRGMYTAWEEAVKTKDYEYYLWLNDDTYLYQNAISTLLETSSKFNNKSIIVGPTVDSYSHAIPTYGGRAADGALLPIDGQLHQVHHFNGNIVLISAEVYNKLGNLDYYYTHSKGDYDYGIRAQKAGVKIFQVGKALGECDVHPRIDKWCDPEVPLRKRWQQMHCPNGMPPKESFHLEKQVSMKNAIFHYITIHIRCLFPSLWVKLGKATLNK